MKDLLVDFVPVVALPILLIWRWYLQRTLDPQPPVPNCGGEHRQIIQKPKPGPLPIARVVRR